MSMIEITQTMILAGIGFEARRLAAAVDSCATSGYAPHPDDIKLVIERMTQLNSVLTSMVSSPPASEFNVGGSMHCELN
jgi:hypothetical protein